MTALHRTLWKRWQAQHSAVACRLALAGAIALAVVGAIAEAAWCPPIRAHASRAATALEGPDSPGFRAYLPAIEKGSARPSASSGQPQSEYPSPNSLGDAAANPSLSISPAVQVVEVGEHFPVEVMISNYADLGAYEFDINFDGAVAQAEGASDSGLLESSGRTFGSTLVSIDNTGSPANVSVAGWSYGLPAGPSGTEGGMATVYFKAIGTHSTALNISASQIVDSGGTPQTVLAPSNGSVLVNTAVNGSLEGYCVPRGWWRVSMDPAETKDPPGGGTIDCRDFGQAHTGPTAFKITGAPTQNKLLKQKRFVTGAASETFTFSGWSYVTSSDPLGGAAYKLAVMVVYTDDTSEEFQVAFSKDSSAWGSWQFGETTFTTAKPYKKFVLFARFFKQPASATAWFDGIRLVRQDTF